MGEKKVEEKKAILIQVLTEYKKEAKADGRGDLDIQQDLGDCLRGAGLGFFTIEF